MASSVLENVRSSSNCEYLLSGVLTAGDINIWAPICESTSRHLVGALTQAFSWITG